MDAAIHLWEASGRKQQVKWNEILRGEKEEMEVLYIAERPPYLEGKPNVNKTENPQQNQSQFSVKFRNNSA